MKTLALVALLAFAPTASADAGIERCEQIFYGPDVEDHVCVDSGDRTCMVYWEPRLPSYAKTCLVGLP